MSLLQWYMIILYSKAAVITRTTGPVKLTIGCDDIRRVNVDAVTVWTNRSGEPMGMNGR